MTTCETCLALVVLNTPTGEPRAAISMSVTEMTEAALAVSTPNLAQRILVGLALIDEDAAYTAAKERAEADVDLSRTPAAVPVTGTAAIAIRLFDKLRAIRAALDELKKTYNGSVSLLCRTLNDQCDLLEDILDVPRTHPRATQEDR